MNKPLIISFPRSGRTWLNVMIGLVRCHNLGISSDYNVAERRKIVDASHDRMDKSRKVDFKDIKKDKSGYEDRKILLLLREPKDVMVSAWLHAQKNKGIFRGTLSEYIRDSRFGIRKVVAWYNIWFENQLVPRAFRYVWYEDLCADTVGQLQMILDFLEIPYTNCDIQFAVETTTLEKMRKVEGTTKKNKDPDSYYFRRGKIGGYVDYMSEEDILLCDRVIDKLTWPIPQKKQSLPHTMS